MALKAIWYCVPNSIKMRIPFESMIMLSGTYPDELRNAYIQRYTQKITRVVFTIVKN